MDNLTLEHLSAYLPYGVELAFIVRDEVRYIDKITGISDIGDYDDIKIKLGYNDSEHIWMFKPILRPLSDLTKEIEHNGEKIVPIDYINGEFSLEIPDKIELQNWVKNRSIHFVLAEWVGIEDLYKLFKLLFKWHFDVFGLIDKGLAIDINILK